MTRVAAHTNVPAAGSSWEHTAICFAAESPERSGLTACWHCQAGATVTLPATWPWKERAVRCRGGGGGSWSRHRSLHGICFWRKAFFLVVHQRTYLGWSTNHVTEIAQNSVTGITSNGHECTVFSFPFARGEQKYIPQ